MKNIEKKRHTPKNNELPKINTKFVNFLKKIKLYTLLKLIKDDKLKYFNKNNEKNLRRLKLYSKFIQKEDLCFNVGAYTGDEARNMLNLGAKVINIEPLDFCVNYMKKRFKEEIKEEKVILLKNAVGSNYGKKQINLCNIPAFSSINEDYIKLGNKTRLECSNLNIDKKEEVEVITLNYLCEKYGIPKFVKIIVETYEYEVLKNLRYKIPIISIVIYLDVGKKFIKIAEDCIKKISSLGKYEFNITLQEQNIFVFKKWKTKKEMIRFIYSLDKELIWGSIYMRLKN